MTPWPRTAKSVRRARRAGIRRRVVARSGGTVRTLAAPGSSVANAAATATLEVGGFIETLSRMIRTLITAWTSRS